MINKLISKTQVSLLEYEGNPSQDYRYGYCRAIQDVLDLEPIPTLGVDEYEKFKADYENRLKADMVAMLEEIQDEMFKQSWKLECICDDLDGSAVDWDDIKRIIQQKINKLKEGT